MRGQRITGDAFSEQPDCRTDGLPGRRVWICRLVARPCAAAWVTGISTGALTAPFAFLGPDYDDKLKQLFTTTTTSDIVEERSLISALFSDSLADTKPLRAMIGRYIAQRCGRRER